MDACTWHQRCVEQLKPADSEAPEPPFVPEAVYQKLVRFPPESPLHTKAREALAAAATDVLAQPKGARTIIALDAPFAAGKSTLVQAWAADSYIEWCHQSGTGTMTARPPRWIPPHIPDAEAAYVPVVYVNLQSDTTSKDLYSQILTFLGYSHFGTRGALAARIPTALAAHGVRLLVLDDAHMLRTHLKQGRATLDAIKVTATELGDVSGMLVLVGSWGHTRDLLDDPQIQSRLDLHTLQVYSKATEQDRRDWQRYLRAWEQTLQRYLPELRSGTLTQAWAGGLFQRTQGFVGDTTQLLAGAARSALRDGRSSLSTDDMSSARLSARARTADLTPRATPSRAVRDRDAG